MATASTRKDQGNTQGGQQHLDQAKNEASTAADKAKEALGHVGNALSNTQGGQQHLDQAKNEASTAADKAKEALGHVGNALSSTASSVGTAVSNTASAVGQKADDAAAGVGTGLKSVAGTIRDQGPQSGMLGQATSTVAGAIESTGQYLSDKQLSGMADDVASMIKSYPIPAVLIGLGVGFLLGRALRD